MQSAEPSVRSSAAWANRRWVSRQTVVTSYTAGGRGDENGDILTKNNPKQANVFAKNKGWYLYFDCRWCLHVSSVTSSSGAITPSPNLIGSWTSQPSQTHRMIHALLSTHPYILDIMRSLRKGGYLGNHSKTHHLDNVMISFHYRNDYSLDVGPFRSVHWRGGHWKSIKKNSLMDSVGFVFFFFCQMLYM